MISWVFMSRLALNCGKALRADAMTFMINGVIVTFLSWVEMLLRNFSNSEISVLSNCVTLGIIVQAWLKCSVVLRRILFIGLRSICPHLQKSGSGWGVTLPPRAIAPVLRALAKALTSLMEIRPPR